MATVYNSPDLIKAFLEHGEIPKIHMPLISVFNEFVAPGAQVIDLGSSVGLLPASLLKMGAKEVICVEGNCPQPGTIAKPNMIWQAYHLTPLTMHLFKTCLNLLKPKVCTARRVIYEIDKTGIVSDVALALKEAGVKQMIIQGCVQVDNPRVRLYNSELEAQALAPHFKIMIRRGPVYYLEAN